MTDRAHSLTVCLSEDIRTDDLEAIKNAILMLKGVLAVDANITDPTSWMAEERARRDLGERLWAVLYDKKGAKHVD